MSTVTPAPMKDAIEKQIKSWGDADSAHAIYTGVCDLLRLIAPPNLAAVEQARLIRQSCSKASCNVAALTRQFRNLELKTVAIAHKLDVDADSLKGQRQKIAVEKLEKDYTDQEFAEALAFVKANVSLL